MQVSTPRFSRLAPWAALCAFLAVFAVLLAPHSARAQTPYNGFWATYFQGKTLSGKQLVSRLEPVINWSYPPGGSPAPGVVPSTNFSTRWEGWVSLDRAGPWTFTYTSDDGGRVWLDNALVIDMWYDHQPFTRSVTLELTAGYHLVRVEYFQGEGSMTSQLVVTPPGMFPDWMGEYFDNPYLVGEPRYRVNDVDINFNWGAGAPDPRLATENFSVRWSRVIQFAAGSYTFSATADDGVRVWVGDTLAIDGWMPQQPRTYTKTLYLDGSYPVRVEYFEQDGQAVMNFFYQPANPESAVSPLDEGWRGELFANARLMPPVACEQAAPKLAFDWGGRSPGCNLPGQLFSARWRATLDTLAAGFYTVRLTVDDGARIYLDGRQILDAWREQPPARYAATVYLDAGPHEWRVEYFQGSGGAQLAVEILAGVFAPAPPVGATQETIVDAQGPGWMQSASDSAWQTVPVGQGGSALLSKNNAFMQPLSRWGRWYPSLDAPGSYQVLVYIPPGAATTRNARYWIYHDGRFDSVAVAQGAYNDAWVSLGVLDFAARGGEFVMLSDVTYEPAGSTTLVWDAVKFVAR